MSIKEHKNFDHTMLLARLRDAKRRYKHHQISQELNRSDLKLQDPLDPISPRERMAKIGETRYLLRNYEASIRQLKKQILECQRRYTKKNRI